MGEENVYQPPVLSPAGTKCRFVDYQKNSNYGITVEYYDENLEKRRRTEVSSAKFLDGLPAKRQISGKQKFKIRQLREQQKTKYFNDSLSTADLLERDLDFL